jgi:hypothetical protein
MEVQLDAVGEAAAVPVVWNQDESVVARLKSLLVGAGSIYLLFAVIGRFVEGMGAVECGCAEDCWCKRPVLSLFRWVFPDGHRGRPACGPPQAANAVSGQAARPEVTVARS